jgi:hypothetical protein
MAKIHTAVNQIENISAERNPATAPLFIINPLSGAHGQSVLIHQPKIASPPSMGLTPSSALLWGAKMAVHSPRALRLTIASLGPSPLSWDSSKGRVGSLSRLGDCGSSQAEGATGRREPVLAAAVRWFADWRNSLLIVKREKVLRWHQGAGVLFMPTRAALEER